MPLKLDPTSRARVAVHKFSSCDGCQLAFLNAGDALLTLARQVDIVHFVEAGIVNAQAPADIAFIEGSISTPEELTRIQAVRAQSRYLITMGACATSGGIQALRNGRDGAQWLADVYANPEFVAMLPAATPIAAHVRVDFELWGCPISTAQVVATLRSLLSGVAPVEHKESLCLACKRSGNVCVLVTRQAPCLGPVTRGGCGALCPRFGRDCYGCYGPSENPNAVSLARRFAGFGLVPADVQRRFTFIHSEAPAFAAVTVPARNGKP
jgi:coenzyme F420-reducing hydrogenase gamma subunit